MKNIIIITICLITFGTNLFAQDKIAVAIDEISTDKVEIVGEVSEYEILGNNLEYLKNLPRPRLFLAYSKNRKFEIETSKKIQKVLDLYWDDAIVFYHTKYLNKTLNEQEANANEPQRMLERNKIIEKL